MDIQTNPEYVRQQKNWKKSVESCTKFLRNASNSPDEIISALYSRLECLFELNNHTAVVNDCRSILQIAAAQNIQVHTTLLARKKLIQSLFLQQKFIDADRATKEWLGILESDDSEELSEIKLILHGLLSTFNSNAAAKQKFTNLMKLLEARLAKMNQDSQIKVEETNMVSCIYCNVSFTDKLDLRAHCQTELHEMMIMSDEGHDWFCRPPPRGFKSDSYVLCQNWTDGGSCRFGVQCVQAHGEKELMEWKKRFRYREMKLQRAREKELVGKSYTEELLEKWSQSLNPDSLMSDHIEEVEDQCSSSLCVTVTTKNSFHNWTFLIQTRKPLKAVALLQDTHRMHFYISSIFVKNARIDLKSDQEWLSHLCLQDSFAVVEYRITVMFKTSIFGTFRQSVVFDFSTGPVLVKHLCADLVPESDVEKINDIRREMTLSIAERWTANNSQIVHFQSDLIDTSDEWEERVKAMFPCPRAESFLISHGTMSDKMFTRNNYRERMHELLYVEEMARYDLISRYNVTTKLQLTLSYILSPNSQAASTAKYSNNGELFAFFNLGRELSEDTSEGRLILKHSLSVYLSLVNAQNGIKRRVYEAYIEDKGKNMIYLRLSAVTVTELQLTPASEVEVQIQFQLNRVPYCEWHYTLDKMSNFKTIFPDTYLEPVVPWSPSKQWSRKLNPNLNVRQKEAVIAITTPLSVELPPILVIGPFGTGKTFTLAQAIKTLIQDASNRILLCTHSNSAADLYIKDYLDPWVQMGEDRARPLRIYYNKRWVSTVNSVVLKYCLIDFKNGMRSFLLPTLDDLMKHQIIVVTFSTAIYLSTMCPPGFFTHILLDEAAQAIECEAITPLVMANEKTRIVLAGDHMQLGPDIYAPFAKQRNLHISLLERLYDHYPHVFSCKILLGENYRAHQSIVQFTSESFYNQKLLSSSKQPRHFKYYPLSFFTTRGEDVQDLNSTAYFNHSEVFEVVDRVAELKRTWPEDWGKFNDQSIGVVTPYADQVFRIRAKLRKKRIDNVCVERVLNVQGKQFRAIILSTVRTRKTCTNSADNIDYGFLSNFKLLNTAITRAQSLVVVVGDPIALCSVGRLSKVWERFIQICHENNSLFGITWPQFKLQLDSIELKKIYSLNPLAPEFVPRSYRVPMIMPVYPPMLYPPPFILNPFVPLRVVPPPPPPPKHKSPMIQFLNNVHFSEAMLSDCINLLPHNMSLADMLLQPSTMQERWYNYLRDSTGEEAAEKFRYLLHTTNQKGSRVQDIFDSAPQSCESPVFNWYDSPTSQINVNKPVYIQSEQDKGPAFKERRIVEAMLELDENDLQRHLEEEFKGLSVRSEEVVSAKEVVEPRFYKYFQ